MKISYVVLTCDKYRDRLEAIKQTWGSTEKLILLSDDTISRDLVGYNSCPYKYKEFFVNHEMSDDWYVFVDDDTYVNTKTLRKQIEASYKKNSPLVVGLFGETVQPKEMMLVSGTYKRNDQLNFPRGGAGILLNCESTVKIQNYIRNTNDIPITRNSDTTLGMWVNTLEIETIFDATLNRRCSPEIIKRVVTGELTTCHYVTPKLMTQIHEYVVSQNDWSP